MIGGNGIPPRRPAKQLPFVRIYNRPMIDFTTLCKLKNDIKPQTCKKVNELLARAAVQKELIDGEQLRLDTTAVETNPP